MIKRLVLFSLCAAGFLCLQVGLVGQTAADPLAADLMKDWSDQKSRMMALAEAMPAEKYEFKATPPQRTFGEQLHHLAEAHVRMFKALDPQSTVPAPNLSADHGKAAVMKSLGEAYDYGAAVLKAQQGSLAQSGGRNSKARTVWAAMGNAMNHYGQCVVYLRLNNIVPPASRPSSP